MDIFDSLMDDYKESQSKSKSKSKSKSNSKSKSRNKSKSKSKSKSRSLTSPTNIKDIKGVFPDVLDIDDTFISTLDDVLNTSSVSDTYAADNTSKLSLLNQRRVHKWVSDDSVNNCYSCDLAFSYFVRKHHCRLCGRIFCDKCSKSRAIIPKDIIQKIPERNQSYLEQMGFNTKNQKSKPEPQRVCSDCYIYINSIISIRKVIKVFDFAGLSIRELLFIRNSDCNINSSMRSLDKAATLDIPDDWREAAEFCIEKFRNIYNKLSIDHYDVNEIRMLWINRKDLIMYDRWLVKLIISISSNVNRLRTIEKMYVNMRSNTNSVSLNGTISSILYYDSNYHCETNHISMENAIGLIVINKNYPTFDTYVSDSIMNTELDVLKDYLPVFISYVETNMYIIDVLLERCNDNICKTYTEDTDEILNFITNVYWCIKTFIHTDGLRTSCIKKCTEFIKSIDDDISVRFNSMIRNVKIDDDWIRDNVDNDEIILPITPTESFEAIDIDNIIIKKSFSRPIIVPFIRSDDSVKQIMYKKDDIRKDLVILNIINIMHRLLNKELDINVECVKYSVMPTTPDEGYIEIVPNASTVFNISQTSNIQNYIMEHNDNITVGKIKERFIKSTALYCVISYLLGFGDRHLENIMISEDGYLFHIDFGYIIGQDPKGSDNRSLRVTPGILSVIGESGSKNNEMFGYYCTKIYSCLRKHVDIFMNILTTIPNIDPTLNMNIIDREIRERFEVGESNIQAVTHMSMKVKNDSNSFDYVIIDFLHRSKHSTIGQFLISCKDAIL